MQPWECPRCGVIHAGWVAECTCRPENHNERLFAGTPVWWWERERKMWRTINEAPVVTRGEPQECYAEDAEGFDRQTRPCPEPDTKSLDPRREG